MNQFPFGFYCISKVDEKVLTGNSPGSADGTLDYIGCWHVNPIIPFPAGTPYEFVHPLSRRGLNFPAKTTSRIKQGTRYNAILANRIHTLKIDAPFIIY